MRHPPPPPSPPPPKPKSAPPPKPSPPPPKPKSAPPPKPSPPPLRQNGNNCRQVALGNLLRLGHEPDRKTLIALTRQMHSDSYYNWTQQLYYTEGVDWTFFTEGRETLMSRCIEHFLPGHVAFTINSAVLRSRPFLQDVMCECLRRPDARGFLYFNTKHCMAIVRRGEEWFDAPQSSFNKCGVDKPIKMVRAAGHHGFTFVLPRAAVDDVLLPAIFRHIENVFSVFSASDTLTNAIVRGDLAMDITDVIMAMRCQFETLNDGQVALFQRTNDEALAVQISNSNEELRLSLQTKLQQAFADTIALQEHIMITTNVTGATTTPDVFVQHCSRKRIVVVSAESIHSSFLMLYNMSDVEFLNDALDAQGYPLVTRVTPGGQSLEAFFDSSGGVLTAQLTAFPAIPEVTKGQAFTQPILTAANMDTIVNKTTTLQFRRSLTSGQPSYLINSPVNIHEDGRVITYISSFTNFQVDSEFEALQLSFRATDVIDDIVIFDNDWDNRDTDTFRRLTINTCRHTNRVPLRPFSQQFPVCRDIYLETALKKNRDTLQPISANDVLFIMCVLFGAMFLLLTLTIVFIHKAVKAQTKLNTQIISTRVQENTHAATLRYLNHELRNPLAIIMKIVKDIVKALDIFAANHVVTKRWVEIHSVHRQLLVDAQTSIASCETVINDLVMFGRADTAIPSIQIKSTELMLRLRDAMLQTLCMFDCSVNIDAFLHDTMNTPMMVDAARIRQILFNCLCNALQHGTSVKVLFYAHFIHDPENTEKGFIVFNIINEGSCNTAQITNLIRLRLRERTSDDAVLETLTAELPRRFLLPTQHEWLNTNPVVDCCTNVQMTGQAASNQIIASDKTTVGLTVSFTVISALRGFLSLRNSADGQSVHCTIVIPTATTGRKPPPPSYEELVCAGNDDIV